MSTPSTSRPTAATPSSKEHMRKDDTLYGGTMRPPLLQEPKTIRYPRESISPRLTAVWLYEKYSTSLHSE